MKHPPFKMKTETTMEKYRQDTFYDKEPETIAWIDSFDPGAVFYDVGANVGVYSLYLASQDPTAKIYAFEPSSANWKAMEQNIIMNGFENIRTVLMAVGRSDKTVRFLETSKESGATGGQISDRGISIPCVTLDKFAKLAPAPDYIKIDIDGQELDVVCGMVRIMMSAKSVLVECSPQSRAYVIRMMKMADLTMGNRFNTMVPHSRERRKREGIPEENIIFTRS